MKTAKYKEVCNKAVENVRCSKPGSSRFAAQEMAQSLVKHNLRNFRVVQGYVVVPKQGKQQHTWIRLEDNTVIDPAFTQFPKGSRYSKSIHQVFTGDEFLAPSIHDALDKSMQPFVDSFFHDPGTRHYEV